MVSSDLPEVLALADRIVVMREGRVRGELRRRDGDRGSRDAPRDARGRGLRMKRFWHVRELSTVAILTLEVLFFTWYLWPEAGRPHPFLNVGNVLLILKYSSIYGIAAIGAAIVIISGGIDLAPGAVIALTTVVTGLLFVEHGWSLGGKRRWRDCWSASAPGSSAAWLIVARAAAAVHRDARRDGHLARRGVHHHRGALLRSVGEAAARLARRRRARSTGWRRSSCSLLALACSRS